MIQYSIYYPGGNITALVKNKNRDINSKKKINDFIMESNSIIEQVGFIWSENNKYYLEMAGGEFCANATRSAIYEFLQTTNYKQISITIPSIKTEIKGGIDSNENIWTTIPFSSNKLRIEKRSDYFIANFNGISQIVIEIKKRQTDIKKLKLITKEILTKTNLISDVKASGVMFLSIENDAYVLDPVVWVRDIQTFFYETACGTGTAAVGLYLNKLNKKIEVLQPSQKKLTVEIKNTSKVIVSGEVTVLSENINLQI